MEEHQINQVINVCDCLRQRSLVWTVHLGKASQLLKPILIFSFLEQHAKEIDKKSSFSLKTFEPIYWNSREPLKGAWPKCTSSLHIKIRRGCKKKEINS